MKKSISIGNISIIHTGGVGFDPLAQRETLGVKWKDGDVWRGFWFDIVDEEPTAIVGFLAGELLGMLGHPEEYELKGGVTPYSSDISGAEKDGDA